MPARRHHRPSLDELLRTAALFRDLRGVRDALKRGADANAKDKFGHTALVLACLSGWVEGIRVLLGAGADPDIPGAGGTALHAAARWGKAPAVEELLRRGADPTLQDEEGNTPQALATREARRLEALDAADGDAGDGLPTQAAEYDVFAQQRLQLDCALPRLGDPSLAARPSTAPATSSTLDDFACTPASPAEAAQHWQVAHVLATWFIRADQAKHQADREVEERLELERLQERLRAVDRGLVEQQRCKSTIADEKLSALDRARALHNDIQRAEEQILQAQAELSQLDVLVQAHALHERRTGLEAERQLLERDRLVLAIGRREGRADHDLRQLESTIDERTVMVARLERRLHLPTSAQSTGGRALQGLSPSTPLPGSPGRSLPCSAAFLAGLFPLVVAAPAPVAGRRRR